MKFFLIYGLSLLFVVGCGGTTGSTATEYKNANLPPDPGVAGKATLAGIDSDNDGVRDDVQIAIYERHPSEPEKRAALEQEASNFQKGLVAGKVGDANEALRVQDVRSRSMHCMFKIIGEVESDNYSLARQFINEQILNTVARHKAYIKYNQLLSGNTFRLKEYDKPCDN